MNSRFRSDWPKGRVDRLKELWPTHSGAEIAREFGCSRSSICGKVSKLVALGEIEPKLSEPEIQRRARTRTKNEEAANPKPPKPEPEVCAPVKLAETTSRHCRFPMWTDNGRSVACIAILTSEG